MKNRYFNQIPTVRVLSLSPQEIGRAFGEVRKDWQMYLKKIGISLPKAGTYKWYQLAILKRYEQNAVHKNDISQLLATLTNKAATDQQVRHLKTQGGWFVLNRGDSYQGKDVPEGCHVLITTKHPSPGGAWQRRAVVAGEDWEKILQQYNYACASCGTKIGEQHRFDKSFVVKVLEKGHMNPSKPLEQGNIIPQCRWCNRTARGDFTFDEQGRPKAIAGIRPVKRADHKVIQEVKKWLLQSKK